MAAVIDKSIENLLGTENKVMKIQNAIETLFFASAQFDHFIAQVDALTSRVSRLEIQTNWYCNKHLVDEDNSEFNQECVNVYIRLRGNRNIIYNT